MTSHEPVWISCRIVLGSLGRSLAIPEFCPRIALFGNGGKCIGINRGHPDPQGWCPNCLQIGSGPESYDRRPTCAIQCSEFRPEEGVMVSGDERSLP